jgi:hypothetical protein
VVGTLDPPRSTRSEGNAWFQDQSEGARSNQSIAPPEDDDEPKVEDLTKLKEIMKQKYEEENLRKASYKNWVLALVSIIAFAK